MIESYILSAYITCFKRPDISPSKRLNKFLYKQLQLGLFVETYSAKMGITHTTVEKQTPLLSRPNVLVKSRTWCQQYTQTFILESIELKLPCLEYIAVL